MKLSEHFTLEELSFSETAARFGLENIPDAITAENLERIAAFMEKIRTLLGNRPIVVHSGYRSPQVNKAVGGVITSAHCQGLACDFACPTFGTPVDVALAIRKSELGYDQLILEDGWVHVSLPEHGLIPRRESLTKTSKEATYQAGIRS
jgi:zinc D-Ala-D-Ala carboxypeptidase